MTNPQSDASRLRVMQCITRLGLGGAERVAFSLTRQLHEEIDFAMFTVHHARRDEVHDAMHEELRTLEVPWFAGTSVPMKAGGMVPGSLALARAVHDFRPDILHFHSETPEACGAAMMALRPQKPRLGLVRSIHNSVFWRYWPRVGRWCDSRLASAYIACVSQAAADEFRRYRHESGAPPPPAEPAVIYNGVSIAAQPPRQSPRDPASPRLLFAGRFEYQKGADLLCLALPLVQLAPGIRAELTFVGDGAYESMISARCASAPDRWAVTMRPAVPSLQPVFDQHDVLVMPSRFEGLGLVAIEATLSGLPIIAADAPGLREALPPDYPWRAAVNDPASLARSISTALTETARWGSAVQAAQAFAQARFSPRAMKDGYFRIYRAAAHPLTSCAPARVPADSS